MSDSHSASSSTERTIEKLLRQQAALAAFGSFAFKEKDLQVILNVAAQICAESLGTPFCKICRYQPAENDLLIVAGYGWHKGVVGNVVSQANESSPQGRAYITGEPVIIRNLQEANNLALPSFYPEHGIVSTVDVLIPAVEGSSYGVLEIDSPIQHQYDEHDISFLTGFANVLAEAVATSMRTSALQALVDEKNLLAEELQHRVRNNLQMVTSMLASYARTATEVSARQGIDQIVRRVTTLAQIYDSLLGVGLAGQIDFGDYLRKLCLSLPGLQDGRTHEIRLICEAQAVHLDLDRVTTLGMIVAELVTNSYGHAFPESGGTIHVTLTSAPTGETELIIRDDGVGFTVQADSQRHGIGLVRRLMDQLHGKVDMHSEGGTRWTLMFDANSDKKGEQAAA